jgi:DNA-binding transcriptional MerR regulator
LTQKGPNAFRTISEAAAEVGAPAHVLRFWESKFNFIRPMRCAGGRRFYRPGDILMLSAVRRLLHDDGYAISQLQRLSAKAVLERVQPSAAVTSPEPRRTVAPKSLDALRAALSRAHAAKARLDGLLTHSIL